MNKQKKESGEWKSRNRKILIQLAFWAGAYLLAMALATFGPEYLWESKWLTMAAIAISFGVGLGMLVANIRQLNNLDEMMRKVQLEAMALSLGIGVIGGLSYSLLDTENIVPFDAEIGHLVILIGITYLIATFIGCKRFQ